MKSPRAEWTTQEVKLLTALWGTVPARKIGQQLHRPPGSIRCKAQRLQLPRITADVNYQFRWLTEQEPPYVNPAEKKMGDDEENQRWYAYWRSRRQERIERIARCGWQV